MTDRRRFYLTTAIAYANNRPGLHTLYEVVGVLRDEEFTGHTQKALNVDNQSLEFYAPYRTVLERHGTLSTTQS